jgi:5-oxoprolinase (ATP-hydrolysing) subunit A
VTEYFVDRNYTADGRLVDRRLPDALLTDQNQVVARAVQAAADGRADSFCTHGDTPGAVELAAAVRSALLAEGFTVAPFAGPQP